MKTKNDVETLEEMVNRLSMREVVVMLEMIAWQTSNNARKLLSNACLSHTWNQVAWLLFKTGNKIDRLLSA